jgi:putative PEP-CTERM system TPR-repeat lipoprotein
MDGQAATGAIVKFPCSKALAVLIACAIALVACSDEGESERLAQARNSLAKNDRKAAIVQLKALLQQVPSSPEGRFLLGKSLLEEGEFSSALIELQKTRELGYPDVEVAPVLAQAMLGQGKNKEMVAEFANLKLPDAKAAADLQTTVAFAALRLGDAAQTERSLAEAFAAVPQYPPAMIVQARVKALANDVDGALRLVEAVTVREPGNAEAWQLKGHFLLYGKQDVDAALVAYRKSLDANKYGIAANSAVIDILLARRDSAGAKRQLADFKKLHPQHPQVRYMEARIAAVDRDFKSARATTLELLRQSPDNRPYLLLAGLTALELNAPAQAEVHLNKLLQAAPQHLLARQMLAQAHLRAGDAAKALEDLRPLLARSEPDSDSLGLAAEAYLQAGDLNNAEVFFNRAVKSRPGDLQLRTALAMAQFSKGGNDAALNELVAISASDPGTVADMALINALMRRVDLDRALKAIDVLQRKQPSRALPLYLRGRVQLHQQNAGAARASFVQALALEKSFFPAVAALAAADVAEGKIDEARQRFEAFLKIEPGSAPALMALAELRARQGAAGAEVAKLIQDAVKASPLDVAPRLALVQQHLSARDFKQAAAAAQDANAALPDNPEVVDALGRVQMASGDVNQAVNTFTRLVALQPRSARPYMRLAAARAAAKSYDAAEQSFKRALEISPGLIEAQQGLIALSLKVGKPQEAVLIARTIQRQHPKEAVGYLFEGEVEVQRRRWDAAADAFRGGLNKLDTGELPARLYYTLDAGQKRAEADRFAAIWLKEHPKDAPFIAYLGDVAMVRKDFASAERYYREVTALAPKSSLAFNNLAWVLAQQQKPGAVAAAEKALVLSPDSPACLDTLAWALASEKQLPLAVETAKKALNLAPANAQIQLTLAKLYLQTGDKELARVELDKLAKLGTNLVAHKEVAQLQASLGR